MPPAIARHRRSAFSRADVVAQPPDAAVKAPIRSLTNTRRHVNARSPGFLSVTVPFLLNAIIASYYSPTTD